jgi:assimilatory nitrate reductase catalytic subunit
MSALAGTHGKLFDLTDWSEADDAEYEAMEPFQWGGVHPLAAGFATPSGKAQLVVPADQAGKSTQAEFPLRLNTGRYRDQWHTMTRTGFSPKLSVHRREPLVEVSADDALLYGLEKDGLARVATAHGSSVYRVAVTSGQRAGQVFVPIHWTDAMAGGGRTGLLAKPDFDPVSGQPGFKNTPARIEPVAPDWRAFLVTRDIVRPEALYWARARIEGGWLFELAGLEEIDEGALLPVGTRSVVTDRARGMRRTVVMDEDGKVAAALFVTRSGVLPDRDWIVRQFAGGEASLSEWLAGRPSTPQPDRGALVCVCFDVHEKDILAAVHNGAETAAEVASLTRAGTNCGSCRTITARLIEEAQASMQEAAE